MDQIDKLKSASNESSNTNKYRVKKNTFKRKKQDFKFGSSAQGSLSNFRPKINPKPANRTSLLGGNR